jgi:hypothetical protein
MRTRCLQVACIATTALLMFASTAQAMTCRISMNITKGGFVVGAAGGSGTLNCNGERYPIRVSGINAGLVIGMSKMSLHGTARHLRRISDIEGTYASTGASAAAGAGGTNILATNEKGVELAVRGRQIGFEASLDLGGMKIRLD